MAIVDVVSDMGDFKKYFFDVRVNKPQKGQVMARLTSMAELCVGKDKDFLVHLLQEPRKHQAIVQYMRKVFCATPLDSIIVPIKIAKDLLDGLPVNKVLKRKYKYQIEFYFYTWKEYVPDDPHWSIVNLKFDEEE